MPVRTMCDKVCMVMVNGFERDCTLGEDISTGASSSEAHNAALIIRQTEGEMKHFIIAIIAVLSVLNREQLFSSAAAKGCPRRYLRRINGKCYYFSVKKLNWFGALNNCLRKGLTLADLSNPRDFYGAIDFLSSKGNTEDFWFGANDLQTEGRFQYISNGRLVRYFSNFSIVEPAEHSECDDCLEVRIRTNMTVVADDNCLERQYFICSERYCNDISGSNKPRHHSHEHLHHFHHDIGEPSEEEEEQTPSPFDSEPEGNESEEVPLTIPAEVESTTTESTTITTADGNETTTVTPSVTEETTHVWPSGPPPGVTAGVRENGPAAATEAPAAAGETPPAAGEAPPAAAGETPPAAAGEAPPAAAGEAPPAAAGEAPPAIPGDAPPATPGEAPGEGAEKP